MRTIPLSPHPATPCPAVHQFSVDYGWQAPGHLLLRYRLRGALAQLRLPPPGPAPTRRDELWRSTCFEAFLRRDGNPGYWEVNFTPRGDWAIYRFDAYRQGMHAPQTVAAPAIACTGDAGTHELTACLDLSGWDRETGGWQLALATVLATPSGEVSYWAAHHPPGTPDFHAAAAFRLTLPPMPRPTPSSGETP